MFRKKPINGNQLNLISSHFILKSQFISIQIPQSWYDSNKISLDAILGLEMLSIALKLHHWKERQTVTMMLIHSLSLSSGCFFMCNTWKQIFATISWRCREISNTDNMQLNIAMCCRSTLEKNRLTEKTCRFPSHMCVDVGVTMCAGLSKEKLHSYRNESHQLPNRSRTFWWTFPAQHRRLSHRRLEGENVRVGSFVPICDFFRFSKCFSSVCFSNAFSLTMRFLGTTIKSRATFDALI